MSITVKLPRTKVHVADTIATGAGVEVVTTTGRIVVGGVDMGPVASTGKVSSPVATPDNAAVKGVWTVTFASPVAGENYAIKVSQADRTAQGSAPTVLETIYNLDSSGTAITDAAALEALVNASNVSNGGRMQLDTITPAGTAVCTITASTGYEVVLVEVVRRPNTTSMVVANTTPGEYVCHTTADIEKFGYDISALTGTAFGKYEWNAVEETGEDFADSAKVKYRYILFYNVGDADHGTLETDMVAALGL